MILNARTLASIFRRHKRMLLFGIFLFYLGYESNKLFLRYTETTPKNAKNNFVLSKVEYAVVILSGPNYKSRRDNIRDTWMKLVGNLFEENKKKQIQWNLSKTSNLIHQEFIKFYFVIGTKTLDKEHINRLKLENTFTQDLLLLESLEDGYKNLAEKMIQGLKWVSENLDSLKYVIKSDDDSFVRVDLIVNNLENYAPEMNSEKLKEYVSYKKSLPSYKGLYWGYFSGSAHIFLKGKWQEESWFLCDRYLPYAVGGGYIISKSIVDYIAKNADFLSRYTSEDVSMGVWTAALDGINRVHDLRFDTQWESRGCDNKMLVRHKQTPSDMLQMYKNLINSNGEELCETEAIKRRSYIYKWDVVPSGCCKP